MKKKSTKLTLAKETLRSLEEGLLPPVQGAGSVVTCSCSLCESICYLCTD